MPKTINVLQFLQNQEHLNRYNVNCNRENNIIKVSYPSPNGIKEVFMPFDLAIDTDLGWFFGLWIGDRSNEGFGVCNKDFNVIKKSLKVMLSLRQPMSCIRSKVYHNSAFKYFEKMELKVKNIGIENLKFYRSPSENCGDFCIYLYVYNSALKLLFKSLLDNFNDFIDRLDKKTAYSILAGIFDAEGSVSLTYNCITIEFKTDCLEEDILSRILDFVGIRHEEIKKNNGMTAFNIGRCEKDKCFLKLFYENTVKYLAIDYKKLNISKILDGKNCFYPHDALYLFYIALHSGCNRKDIRIAFGKKGREITRLKLKNLLNGRYLKVSKFKRENKYYITNEGLEFIRKNLKLIIEIANECKKNGKWGKGPIFKLSPFIYNFANRKQIVINPKCLGSMQCFINEALAKSG